jgi:hypothetical protein
MTDGTVNGAAFGRRSVIQGPDRSMGLEARESYGFIKFFIMTFQTRLLGREHLLGIIFMTMKTGWFFDKKYLMFLMIELDC